MSHRHNTNDDLPSSFILRYVRAEMNVHAFMNELDQKDY